MNQLGSKSNRGLKIESATVFSTSNYSKSLISIAMKIGIARSRVFVMRLELVQK
jgi:hypothetical protein